MKCATFHAPILNTKIPDRYTGGPRWSGEETSIISSGGVGVRWLSKGLRRGLEKGLVLRGDLARMILGLNEDSSTEGATYVKPWKQRDNINIRIM